MVSKKKKNKQKTKPSAKRVEAVTKSVRDEKKSAVVPLRRRPIFWGLCLLLVCTTLFLWPRYVQPFFLMRSAHAQLETDPMEAADLAAEATLLRGGDHPQAQLLWTRALLKAGRRDEAVGCFSLIDSPERIGGTQLIELGHEAMEQRLPLLAQFAFEAVPSDSDKQAQAIEGLIAIRYQQKNWFNVTELWEQLTAAGAVSSPETYIIVATASERMGDFSGARDLYSRFEKSTDSNVDRRHFALSNLTRLALQFGDIDEAQQWMNKLEKIGELTPEEQILSARLSRFQGDIAAATAVVNSVLKLDATNQPALTLRGSIAFDESDFEAAVTAFREVLKASPYNKEVHYKLAQALQLSGNGSEAEKHFERNRELTKWATLILELQQSHQTGKKESVRLQELAQAYEALGQFESAKRVRLQLNAIAE